MTRSLAASLIFFDKADLSAHLWLNEDYIFSHKEIKIADKANFLMIFCLRSNMDEWTGSTFMSVSADRDCLQAVNTGSKLWPIEVQQEHTVHVHIPATTSFLSTCMSRITNIFTISMSILSTGTVWKPNFDLICNTIKLLSTYGQNKDILKEKKYSLGFCTVQPSLLYWLPLASFTTADRYSMHSETFFGVCKKCQCSNKSLMLFVFLEFLA